MTETTAGRSERALGPTGFFPLAVLFGLNLVDEFDRSAFMTLAPEIRDALGMSDAAIVSVGTLAFASVVFLSVPIGYLADRRSRVGISIVAAALWSIAAVATGLATAVGMIFAARCAAGTGRLVNDTIHPSLLSNYYRASSLPLVTAVHRSATFIGTVIAGPVAGVVAAAFGWRPTFFIAAVPTIVLILLATRLREPPRSDGVAPADPHTFISAFSELRRISTLRRIWLAAFLYGAAFIPFISTLLSLFFEREHGFGTEARGLVLGLYGLGALVGVFLGWPAARRIRNARPGWFAQLLGLSFALFGGAVVLMVGVPAAAAAVAFSFLAATSSAYLPAYTTLIALISPPALRSQGYTYVFFFYALGAIAFSPIAAWLVGSAGISATCTVVGVLAVIAGVVAASAKKSAETDATTPPDVPRSEASLPI